MIDNLIIKNYKSIKNIKVDTKRINIFIGEHNSGKSNILEALSWFSINSFDKKVFPEIFRFKNATNFFYDFETSVPIEVKSNDLSLMIKYATNKFGALNNQLQGIIYSSDSTIDPNKEDDWYEIGNKYRDKNHCVFNLFFDGSSEVISENLKSPFRTYIFKSLKKFESNFRNFLNPPFGENIPALLLSNKKYKEMVSAIFKAKDFRLMLKPTEDDIDMAKDVNDELYSYPYNSISETLQRIIFYSLVIETNKNATIILDEPESNTFPMYTKQLAEMIALDKSNQYFIVTHDPYMLNSIVSKAAKKDLSVFITKMQDYKTIVSKVETDDLSKILDKGIDIYFNLNKLISE
ncbi:AAA family ATPase [Fulvivirgaceae bacterium BMA12]|uniref:AAA family ATPase n=1 Tax=Agaribacillus aureus TaxID=3051825 RepID=A0ABT8LGQ0_9BACT|nr:AAA family ATPase [Fulvivirgaceae bacterium BMA12]